MAATTIDGSGQARARVHQQHVALRAAPAPGRELALNHIAAFVRDWSPGVRVLAIIGDPGIGKTHVWRVALQTVEASGIGVLRSRASADESAMDYVVLTDLLSQVPGGLLDALPGPRRQALEVAAVRQHPNPLEPHDVHAVGLALHELIERMSPGKPVVLAFDDAHHMDTATAAVLTFAMRRLGDHVVRVLLTAPDERDIEQLIEPWHASAAEIIRLETLPVDAFAALVGAHRAEMLFPRRLSRLHAAAGGNPAIALAILDRLEEYRTSAGRLDRFPIPARLEDSVAAAVLDVDADVSEVLRVVSAMSRPTVDAVAEVVGEHDAAMHLGHAIGDGVLHLQDERLFFVDPLLSSYLYHQMSVRDRLQLHRRLSASIDDPDERALHTALSTERPDAGVAAAVAVAAADAQARGDQDAAAELGVEAVRLTPDGDAELLHDRARMAAKSLVTSGDISHAATLLEHTAGRRLPTGVHAELLLLLARLRSNTDHAGAAVHLLGLALSEAAPEQRARLAGELAVVLVHNGYLEEAERELAVTLEATTDTASQLAHTWLSLATGRLDGTDLVAAATTPDPLLPAVLQPAYVRAVIDISEDRLGQARGRLRELQRRLALSGDDLTGGHISCRLSEVERVSGNAGLALTYADAACTMARRTGLRVLLPFALARQALALARLGRLEDARAAAQEGVAVAAGTGARRAEWLNHWALGFAALSEGDHDEAVRQLVPVAQAAYVAGFAEPAMLRWVPDTVEALVGVGDHALAAQLLEPYAQHASRLGRSTAMFLAERCRGLIDVGKDRAHALLLLDHAVARATATVDPFELARTMLVAGLLHRRHRHDAQGGRLLHQALDIFVQIGAETWVTRLRREMVVGPARHAGPLTSVEQEVAELASNGLTNRQIASQLFISPKTVETHLSSAYRKLGIRSRAELARNLAAGGGADSATPVEST